LPAAEFRRRQCVHGQKCPDLGGIFPTYIPFAPQRAMPEQGISPKVEAATLPGLRQ
jgi:hypothetical protein